MNCPVCGKKLIQTEKALRCSGWKEGCEFTVWNTIAGHVLTEQEKEDLIKGEIIGEIRDFRSKAGKPFSARLKLDEEGKAVFVFPDQADLEDGMKCPVCGKAIRRNRKVWCCTDRECGFVIFDSLAGHLFTEEEKRALVEGTQIGPINDFVSRAGKQFTAFVKIGDNGKTRFVFPEEDTDEDEMEHGGINHAVKDDE